MPTSPRYLVVGSKPWSRETYDSTIRILPGTWTFCGKKEDLTLEALNKLKPSKIFLLHWSEKIPLEILKSFECIGFHMTDLPYGRGGSPLQNLIVRGHKTTKLSAFRMTSEFDAGPIYLKADLSLEGTAQEIYERASQLAAQMIKQILEENIVAPVAQKGEVAMFKRRRPDQSEMPSTKNLSELYDFIRMLDADGYPRAFLTHGGVRYEFSQAKREGDRLVATVAMTSDEASQEKVKEIPHEGLDRSRPS